MARNKYPEQTVELILETARRLFLEKGYEATTIQDIVDGLGGLTKGAVYHHFKSIADIMNALGDKLFAENDPFRAVEGRDDLNGLEKLREVVRLHQADAEQQQLSRESIPMLKNPRVLAEMLETNRRELSPRFLKLIEEGRADGSIRTDYAPELDELIPLLSSLWLAPTVYPATAEGLRRKFRLIGEMLTALGLPLVDESVLSLADEYISQL